MGLSENGVSKRIHCLQKVFAIQIAKAGDIHDFQRRPCIISLVNPIISIYIPIQCPHRTAS